MIRGAENPVIAAGIVGLHALYRRGAITPAEAFEVFQGRAERLNPSLNAIVHWNTADAELAASRSAFRWRKAAPLSVLDGVPLAIKANLAVRDLPWTGAIAAYKDRIAKDDSAVVKALRGAGAIILGIANMHEAALGATTTSPLYGPAQNPLRPGFTPGGSSGGSAAAVAAGLVAGAIGTDTLGSVRLPSSYCGIAGFKPSFGRVSRTGMQLLSYSLDHVGVHARYARDLLPLMSAIAGRDPTDPFSTGLARLAFTPASTPLSLAGLKMAALSAASCTCIAPGVLAAYETALKRLQALGIEIDRVDLEEYQPTRLRRLGLLVCEAEGSALMDRDLRENPSGFSEPLRQLLAYGATQSATKLAAAQWDIASMRSLMGRVFAKHQAFLSPTVGEVAFDHKRSPPTHQADLTALANFAGLPAVSIPMGFAEHGLPAGLQIMTAFSSDHVALSIAAAIETAGLVTS
jgi:aspartyl-tRNA(Asn)/glutamyl-tRNA(Gln) amidotransferase subunit A